MEWKFWKRKSKRGPDAPGGNGARTAAETPFARLPRPYAMHQLIALQRVVGNQVVLQMLGLRKDRPERGLASRKVERIFGER